MQGETVASRAGVLYQARCQIAGTSLGEDLGSGAGVDAGQWTA